MRETSISNDFTTHQVNEELVKIQRKETELMGVLNFIIEEQSKEKFSLADVIIQCDDGIIPCHSIILMNFSYLFEELIKENSKVIGTPCEQNRVHILLPDFYVQDVTKVLQVFYGGNSNFPLYYLRRLNSIINFFRIKEPNQVKAETYNEDDKDNTQIKLVFISPVRIKSEPEDVIEEEDEEQEGGSAETFVPDLTEDKLCDKNEQRKLRNPKPVSEPIPSTSKNIPDQGPQKNDEEKPNSFINNESGIRLRPRRPTLIKKNNSCFFCQKKFQSAESLAKHSIEKCGNHLRDQYKYPEMICLICNQHYKDYLDHYRFIKHVQQCYMDKGRVLRPSHEVESGLSFEEGTLGAFVVLEKLETNVIAHLIKQIQEGKVVDRGPVEGHIYYKKKNADDIKKRKQCSMQINMNKKRLRSMRIFESNKESSTEIPKQIEIPGPNLLLGIEGNGQIQPNHKPLNITQPMNIASENATSTSTLPTTINTNPSSAEIESIRLGLNEEQPISQSSPALLLVPQTPQNSQSQEQNSGNIEHIQQGGLLNRFCNQSNKSITQQVNHSTSQHFNKLRRVFSTSSQHIGGGQFAG